MHRFKHLIFLVSLIAIFFVSPANAELIGGVEFPDGAVSFTDAVAEFAPVIIDGEPTEPFLHAEESLGVPDGQEGQGPCGDDDTCTFVSLGDGGSITLQFLDNVLTGSGDDTDDLWVFEIGPDVEDTYVEISVDGTIWHAVGKVFGATAGIDIDAYGFDQGDRFSYVRLTDDTDEGQQSGNSVGADIDAVGAIASEPECSILAVSPSFPWSVGEEILITGAGFLEGSVPMINGVDATPFTQISDTEILATIPAVVDGQYQLTVSMPGQIDCTFDIQAVDNHELNWGALKASYYH